MTSQITADRIERQFVDHEHRRVRAGLATLRDTVDEAHRLVRPETVDGAARTLAWLRHDLLPHAAWEEAWLYPHIDTEAGTPWATRALRFEHEQIREAAWEVETAFEAVEDQWSLVHAFRIAVALARLEALVSAHLAQEERFVLPLLEAEEAVAAL